MSVRDRLGVKVRVTSRIYMKRSEERTEGKGTGVGRMACHCRA